MIRLDGSVVLSSAFEVAGAKSDEDTMIDLVLSLFYLRFYGGRSFTIRGEG